MKNQISPETTLILGVGNIVMCDEGFGVSVARRLMETELPANVRVEEGGVGGFNLLGSLEGITRLIAVDVMMLDMPSGEICLFKPGPDFNEPGKRIISFHQVGVIELVQMWGLLGYKPETFFLVTRPEKLDWGTQFTPSVREAADKAFDLLCELCRENFAGLERSVNSCTL
ncbi:MAG: hydrogenase maturation protease [Dehalococcoidales bacterium]|nr:hydrogenase maturation protease [Dehalococcoidales bacterium]